MPRIVKYAEGVEREVARVLAAGGVAAIPTDTCYGLVADATSEPAVRRVFELKRRPLDKVVSVFVDSVETVKKLFIVEGSAEKALALLPGRVTLVLRPKDPNIFARGVLSKSGGVGVRLPEHPLPPAVASVLRKPITATSANISGRPPLYSARDVVSELPGVDLVVDAGELPCVPTSTVIDLTVHPPRVLRAGAVDIGTIARVLGVPEHVLVRR